MRVFRASFPVPSPTALTIGNFDGVHRGHAALLGRLTRVAASSGLSAAVLTFEPHPREFFSRQSAPARLTPLREKLELLAACGAEAVMVCRFDAALAALSAGDFVERILVGALKTRILLIGDDFRFGRGREGDVDFLRTSGGRHGFEVEAMESVFFDGVRVSSSAVRKALAAGEMARASQLLGRPYLIDGRVVRGEQLGRRLGFHTANIRIRHDPPPMTGVFAVEVAGLGGILQGAANLGLRPTLGGLHPVLEVHLFDFHRDIYGAHLSVRFVHKLRDERRFSDLDALRTQIALDTQAARNYFRGAGDRGQGAEGLEI